MNDKNMRRLLEYIENNNGILSVSDLKELNIHRQYVKILCDNEVIEKVSRGVYVKREVYVNDFYITQHQYKNSIFSHATALFLYNLTDYAPEKYDLTFKETERVKKESIKAHYVDDKRFNIGLTTYTFDDSTTVKVYNMERTIIDCLRDKNKMDRQIVVQALKEYVKRPNKNLTRLYEYAKIFHVDKLLRTYMEVLL